MALGVRYQASTLPCQPARAAHPVAPAPGSSGPAKRADDIDVDVDVDVGVDVWKVPTLQCSALPCAAHPPAPAPAPSTHARAQGQTGQISLHKAPAVHVHENNSTSS
ncbi:hypothetical protein E4U43_002324 [Claviceps pusilla]|uniref:Uncharacterized protein n=1 Tax=Claviceps pusilla TaxID=123648 RepID=A0A9P7N8X4_9HYPO|nr:hypothetical protein E4U43_002324 [Claviceps pusilla]